MKAAIYSFLSLDYSGLVIAAVLFTIGVAGYIICSPKLVRWLCLALSGLALVLAVGAVSHLVRLRAAESRLEAPGTIVSVHGMDIHLMAEGPINGPTVVWFGGGYAPGLSLWEQHRRMRDNSRSILIDRPGTGWSTVGSFPRTTATEAEEIMAALNAAGEHGPFIFAGHSFGGLLAANIARRYPDETAGLVLLDATPLDVVFYGADKKAMGGMARTVFYQGLKKIFGLYSMPPLSEDISIGVGNDIKLDDPMAVMPHLMVHARSDFATASMYEELSAQGLVERAWDTMVFDGELGDMPLYLVAPGPDKSLVPYTESVLGQGAEADRFLKFLVSARERYMQASHNAKRVYAPDGTGHNFVNEVPDFLAQTMKDIHQEILSSEHYSDQLYKMLAIEWPGAYGGVPPIQYANAQVLKMVFDRVVTEQRATIQQIANNQAPASFENTVLELERRSIVLKNISSLIEIFVITTDEQDIKKLASEISSTKAQLVDEMAHSAALFHRVDEIYKSLPGSVPDEQSARLVTVIRDKMVRQGALLQPADQDRLMVINKRLAELQTKFSLNIQSEEGELIVATSNLADLGGLTDEEIAAAKKTAMDRGQGDSYAIAIARPTVWPVLTRAKSRNLREKVWRAWAGRGANPGPWDNAPIMTEILRLRGEKARLLGYENFAQYQTADRMIKTPENALSMMEAVWEALCKPTEDEVSAIAELAKSEDQIELLEPWDRLYYAEIYKQKHFDLDAEAIKPYLKLDNIVQAMFWSANQLYGFEFRAVHNVPTVSADIQVYEVMRDGDIVGVLWLDMFQRAGKMPSSWATEYRAASDIGQKALPLAAMHSAIPTQQDGQPVLIPWERANVIFHEFGHTLHSLSNAAKYPSLGNLAMPWDFIEVPSLLNERWLMDRKVLKKFALHYQTQEPIPDSLIEKIERVAKYDRGITTTLNYLGSALVDMKLHVLANGMSIDAQKVERQVLEDLKLPRAIDLTLYVSHAFHTFSPQYAAGVYTYLWSDIIASDIAESFQKAPGGMFDKDIATQYRHKILDIGFTVPTDQAFRNFAGRDPDPSALMRRFDLVTQ